MTITLVLAISSAIVSLFGLLFGAGLLSKLFSNDRKRAVQEYQHNEMQKTVDKQAAEIQSIKSDIRLSNQSVEDVKERMKKLDLIEVVHANVQHLMKATDAMMPRSEAEGKIKAVEEKVDTLQDVVLHRKEH